MKARYFVEALIYVVSFGASIWFIYRILDMLR